MKGLFQPKNLVLLKNKHKYTWEFIANSIGVSESTVEKWKQGDNYPQLKNLRNLADFFGVDVAFFSIPFQQLIDERIELQFFELCDQNTPAALNATIDARKEIFGDYRDKSEDAPKLDLMDIFGPVTVNLNGDKDEDVGEDVDSDIDEEITQHDDEYTDK